MGGVREEAYHIGGCATIRTSPICTEHGSKPALELHTVEESSMIGRVKSQDERSTRLVLIHTTCRTLNNALCLQL